MAGNVYQEYYNSYIEIMVKKRKTPLDYLKIAGILLGAFLLIWFFIAGYMLTQSIFSVLFIALTIFAAYLLLSMQNIEYEYNLTAGELDVAAIYSRKKRTRLANIKCNHMLEFGPYDQNARQKTASMVNGKKYKTVSNLPDKKQYFIVFGTVQGKTNLLVFEPNEDMARAIEKQRNRLKALGQLS